MITNITLKNFKGHTNTSIDLGKITVLAGRNGAGKTSVLQALHFLSMLTSQTYAEVFPDATEQSTENLVKRGAADSSITASVFGGAKPWNLKIELKSPQSPSGRMLSYPLEDGKNDTDPGTNSSFIHAKESVKQAFQAAVYLKLTVENLAAPSVPLDIHPRVEYNGAGLASAIAYLITSDPERFKTLEDWVKQLLPFVQKIRVQKKAIGRVEKRILTVDGKDVPYDARQTVIADELVLDLQSAEALPAHSLSEGTLLILGLLTVLVSPNCPNLVLLDDIEQGLHPKAQRDLVRGIQYLVNSRDFLQIVMTTHSPYVIDELDPKDIWLLNELPHGEIFARNLQSHPDVEKGMQALTTGEFWSAVGEDWVGVS